MTKKISIALIEFYQKFISPFKGFRCASSVVYGCPSCSSQVKSIIESKGVISGIPEIKDVFATCKQAYSEYQENRKNGKNQVDSCSNSCSGCDPTIGCFEVDACSPNAHKCDIGDCDIGDCDVGSCHI